MDRLQQADYDRLVKSLFLKTLCIGLLFLVACQTDVPDVVVETAVSTQPPPTPIQQPTLTPTPSPTPLPTATVTPEPTATATTIPTPAFPLYDGTPLDASQVGVQIHIHNEDLAAIFEYLERLNVGWVKVQVSWKLYQPEPDRFDDYRFGELSDMVERANASNIKVLLSVAKAPEWSRPTTEMDGPPSDYALYTAFMTHLAERYGNTVAAYELWNEPNLQREWNGVSLSAADFVQLVAAGAAGVRAVDSEATLISGAPAPTGINDGITAVDDRQYLQEMLQTGVSNAVDAIGIHPYGWANPPDSSVHAPDLTIPTHNNHHSFFFRDTYANYQAQLAALSLTNVPLWATEFGWGSFEGFDALPPDSVAFMANVSEWQQAVYTLRAIEMGQTEFGSGPMILWNLNFGPTLGPRYSESGFSLLREDGTARPVYLALENSLQNSGE
ncbi:MAG: cellulase family glycosylhydrolase [Chloroflexota bacterium]